MAELAASGVHAPDVMPFSRAWTDQAPDAVALSVIQRHWQNLGSWTPQDWSLKLAVFHGGAVVGEQSIGARDLAITGEVRTGSWLGQRHQGLGFGTEMRVAVLDLAFAHLGAQEAVSAAFDDNAASHAVSAKLGYQPDGYQRRAVRGRPAIERRLRLDRAQWDHHRTVQVDVEGLAPCLPLMGLGSRDDRPLG